MRKYVYLGLAILALAIGAIAYRTMAPERGEFGGVSLRIEYAMTEAVRERGLSGRASLAPDEAMLFVFPKDDTYGFWMKDMLIPIDIYWLDAQGQVVSMEREVAPETYPNVFYPSAPARYVLETRSGFARDHSVTIGSKLKLKDFPIVSK